MTHLTAVYGSPRDRSPELMAAAWLEALGHLTPLQLHGAASAAIRTLKFWPTPAEILTIVEVDRELPPRLPEYRAEPVLFRDDASRQRVRDMVRGMRAQFSDAAPVNPDVVMPASQDMWASDALRNSKAARNAIASSQARASCIPSGWG